MEYSNSTLRYLIDLATMHQFYMAIIRPSSVSVNVEYCRGNTHRSHRANARSHLFAHSDGREGMTDDRYRTFQHCGPTIVLVLYKNASVSHLDRPVSLVTEFLFSHQCQQYRTSNKHIPAWLRAEQDAVSTVNLVGLR